MRNHKRNARLDQARGQMFICGIFGNCANSVLSPRTPPGLQDFGRKAAIVWAANDCNLQQQDEIEGDSTSYDGCRRSEASVPTDAPPSSPSASDADNASSLTSTSDRMECSVNQEARSEGRSSTTSESSESKQIDVDELLEEVKSGNCTKKTISSLNKLAKECEACTDLIQSSRVASALVVLLQSRNLSPTDVAAGAAGSDSDDESDFRHLLEESFGALTVLSGEESTTLLMATPEMLAVVMWFLKKGSKSAKLHASLILEKLSLVESFKGIMGGFPQAMEGIVNLLRDEKQQRLVKLATKTVLALCLQSSNRPRAVEAGVIGALLEMLPMANSATAEKALATIELLVTTEEGKAEVSEHALAVPILVDMILRVSDRGTEYAAGTLSSICSDSTAVQEAAVASGAPTKLLLLIQSDCTARAKRKASQLLKLLHKLWLEDPCNPDLGGTKAIHY